MKLQLILILLVLVIGITIFYCTLTLNQEQSNWREHIINRDIMDCNETVCYWLPTKIIQTETINVKINNNLSMVGLNDAYDIIKSMYPNKHIVFYKENE